MQSFHLISTLQALVAGFALFGNPSGAGATLLGLVGVDSTVDHAADRMQQLVDSATNAARALEAQTNMDVENRINDVQKVADNFEIKILELEKTTSRDTKEFADKVNALAEEHEQKIEELEEKLMKDLSAKIREVECTADRILNVQLKDALGQLGVFFGTHELTITPPVLYEGEHTTCEVFWNCRVSKKFTIYDPFSETYKEIRVYIEDRLRQIREDTPSTSVIDSYAIIADLAKRAACFTFANDMTYESDFIKYSGLVRRWNNVLTWR